MPVRQIVTLGDAAIGAKKVYLLGPGKHDAIECDLYDELAIGSRGQIPPELILACPRCDSALRVDGTRHHIDVVYLDPPRRLVMPDNGQVVAQPALITIEGLVQCRGPAPAGKGLCGWRAYVREGRIYKV